MSCLRQVLIVSSLIELTNGLSWLNILKTIGITTDCSFERKRAEFPQATSKSSPKRVKKQVTLAISAGESRKKGI